jgi:hypothetical protein
VQGGADECNLRQDMEVTPSGFEPCAEKSCEDSELRQSAIAGAAKSGAVPAVTIPDDPALQRLIEAWPRLPEAVRTGIVSMVRSLLGQ